MHEGKAALPLIKLHRGHADIHHDGIDLRDAHRGKFGAHRGKARRMEREAAVEAGDERLARSNRIGIAVEGMNTRAGIEQRGRIAARTEGGIDNRHAFARTDRGDHFIEQHGNVRGVLRDHAAPPLRAPAISVSHAACALFHSVPISFNCCGAQMKKNSPAA